ncbi:MAG: class I SAM-dependent methyltransferase [Betaproteobacteria bacterium]
MSGFYERWILPRLTDLAMRNKEVKRYRRKVIPAAAGRVLEIGGGSGLNLPYYGGAVSRLTTLDPSESLVRMARKKLSRAAVPVELLLGSAEEIPLADRSVDTVVSTWTLCSIPDVARALREARRVLKPGGSLLFVEHGHAPDPRVAAWQRRIEPLWKPLAGGCHLTRRIDTLIAAAGFEIVALEHEYLKGPRPLTYTYCGQAR